jgi:tetratricopeptide (TPR) repeat protein
MNLLARILSHGFALALVALIAVALMYRGELFPEWELPEFLVIDDKSAAGQAETPAGESHLQAEAVVTSPAPAVQETLEETPAIVVVPPPAAYQDNSVASEPAAGSPVTPATEQVVDDSAQEAAVVSDTEVDEPLDADEADEADEADQAEQADQTNQADQVESDSGGQAALDYQAVDSGAVVSDTAVVEEAPQQIDAVVEEVPQQTDAVTPAAEAASSPDKAPVQEQAEALAPVVEDNAKQLAPEPEPEPVDPEPEAPATMPEPVIPGEPAPQAEPPQPSVSTSPSQPSDLPAEAVDSSSAKTAYELLAAAREAYWLRDYEGAEKYYLQLIEVEPDNPDGYGELGNMYFAQGQWEQAAVAYYDAGVRMINEGMTVQARQLVDVIRGLNGGQADELEKQVDAASQNTP